MARNAAPRRTPEVPRRTPDAPAARAPRAPRRSASSLPRLGPIELTPFRIVIGLAFLGSGAYILWAILKVRDTT